VRVDVVGGVVPQLESLTESSCLKPNLVLSEINLSEAGEDAQRQMHDQSICIFFLPCAVHMREAAELVYSLSVSLIGNSHFSPSFLSVCQIRHSRTSAESASPELVSVSTPRGSCIPSIGLQFQVEKPVNRLYSYIKQGMNIQLTNEAVSFNGVLSPVPN
jgi:hypothetical protein